jgi:hypothetical protein
MTDNLAIAHLVTVPKEVANPSGNIDIREALSAVGKINNFADASIFQHRFTEPVESATAKEPTCGNDHRKKARL